MIWLNRLQQRLSLTRNEAMALLCVSGLLMIGLVARHVQQKAVVVPIGAYEEMDRLFFERSAAMAKDTSRAARAAPGNADEAPAPAAAPAERTLRVDVNTAGPAELEKLPRIGPKMAERILAFRAEFGPFGAVDDLQQIRGIGAKTVELLRPHVNASPVGTTSPPASSLPGDSLAR